MGLDFGFYRDHQEIHSVDGHGALFELFDSQIGGPAYDGYDDFLVTEETLDVASRKLALRLYRAGIADSPVDPKAFEDLRSLDERSTPSDVLLLAYQSFLEELLREVGTRGPLVCAYSA
ncbi:MAG: hypothetical protein HOY44_22085 [Maritimibacter sp.]|jgi:hypothetical protein|uniref:hypothetical protein n=1 Tax=Maritimibacter sp. TaxID=2003363 RepID=UPI001D29DE77|nr:hypothetical protein [Maritimibacter sp.]MBL6430210.1 hypothetical protein [Maritimibacter sp.]